MPAAATLYDDLVDAGFLVQVEQGKLTIGPRHRLTADWRGRIRAHRDELLAYLVEPRRAWLIHDDGKTFSATFTPPANFLEVKSWYPEAEIQPEDWSPSCTI